jgi:hypothetical protein
MYPNDWSTIGVPLHTDPALKGALDGIADARDRKRGDRKATKPRECAK